MAAREGKPPKVKKIKRVRDGFTMPEAEYLAISALKTRCLGLGVVAKKSQILGALLAAQASGCGIESGAMACLRHESEAGGGIAAAHAPSAERLPFIESARRLAERPPR